LSVLIQKRGRMLNWRWWACYRCSDRDKLLYRMRLLRRCPFRDITRDGEGQSRGAMSTSIEVGSFFYTSLKTCTEGGLDRFGLETVDARKSVFASWPVRCSFSVSMCTQLCEMYEGLSLSDEM
jgi:hypothetical protein